MNNQYFTHKKIGIWGFGVVGKSVYDFIKQLDCSIQILDKQHQNNPCWIAQTDLSTDQFLEHNEIIVTSPGIPLHNYQKYQHKFVTELDIFAHNNKSLTIAITGTLGKTSITHAINHCTPNSIAAGNIGFPMLTAADQESDSIILELSSFQLQYIKSFAPDIALWTNFYPNHLDHHSTENEYFAAKCNIFKYQNEQQFAIIPCYLIERILSTVKIKSQIFLTCNKNCKEHAYPTFELQGNKVIHKTIIFPDITTLPTYTYPENWLQIIATLYLQNIDLTNLASTLNSIPAQEDRLEKIGEIVGTTFYNDSKSTVWQATQQAIQSLGNESCALFLGGISKGTDRSPLIAYLENKPITVFAFGKEAQMLQNLCNQYNVPCFAFQTVQEALEACMSMKLPKNILFSPSGASFDQFKNYHHRGTVFKDLVKKITASF